MMLNSPELDVRLVATDTGDTTYRAKICAKLLEIAGRTDVPVAVGIDQGGDGPRERQAKWVEGYDLAKYPGKVCSDGVDAIVRTIVDSKEPVTLICIGPVPNIAEALRREPGIALKAKFVGMHGSIRRQHGGKDGAIAEYNVKKDPKSCRAVFEAPWDIAITPLDTCGIIRLTGAKYQAIRDCKDPVTRAVIENYDIWRGGNPDNGASSILFDTVAIYMAFTTKLLVMEDFGVRVTDDGFTVRDEKAHLCHVAMDWKDLGAYEDFLVARLTK